jgi:uncharacterized phage-like protein YoqJ
MPCVIKAKAARVRIWNLPSHLKFSQISGARGGYAEALANVASMEQKYEILKVINETTVLYTQVWLLSERKKLYENYANDADKMKKLVKESAGQGQTSPAASHLFLIGRRQVAR